MTYPSRQISIAINCPANDIYAFASRPENLPKWASGLSESGIRKSGDEWVSDSPMGQIHIKFAAQNQFGILDHDVTLPNGEVNYNPFRVIKNESGSEAIFTLYRLPRMSDQDFEQDARMIETDLQKLKSILET